MTNAERMAVDDATLHLTQIGRAVICIRSLVEDQPVVCDALGLITNYAEWASEKLHIAINE